MRQGIIPSAPLKLTLGFSVQVLELFRVAHLRCPHFSQQAFVKTLSDLQTVSWGVFFLRPSGTHDDDQVQYQKYLTRQFSIAFNLYLSILDEVDNRVKTALGRKTGNWKLQHACPPCMYKLRDEPDLLFSMLWAMDGNNSLSRLLRRSATSQDDEATLGPSCERNDTRNLSGDMYISRDDVDKWAREVVAQVQSASEGVMCIHFVYARS